MRCAPGQIMVLFALAVTAMVALLALVVDGGSIYVQRRTSQNAADSAALAGARALQKAQSALQVSDVAGAISHYASVNAFGIVPSVPCAYFVGSDGSALPTGGLSNDGSIAGCPATTATIPSAASGVHVDTRVTFPTYIMGMFNLASVTAVAHATAQVGVLTASDTRIAPLIACGGGGGTGSDALKLTTQTPVVVTTTPGVLAATPAVLPVIGNPQVTTDQVLVTPVAATPPAYVVDPHKDGTIYYIKGQQISTSNGSNCGAGGFHGAAATAQPTPYIQDVAAPTPAIIVGQTGNAVPAISQSVATSGACRTGTDPASQWTKGQPGCVMILPVVNGSSGLTFAVQAWAAFYVWCSNSTGAAGCQEFSGQLLTNWPVASGPAVNTWTFGSGGGLTVLHLTQ